MFAAKPMEQMGEDLSALRRYARKAVLQEHSLNPDESADQARMMRECLAIGTAFGLTKKQVVLLLYRNLFSKPACDCPTCRFRRGDWP